MLNIKIPAAVSCLVMFLLVSCPARQAMAQDDPFQREEMIGRELDCVEKNIGEGGVSWSNVCYTGSSVDWEDAELDQSAEQYYNHSVGQRELQQRKLKAISQSLDDWDQIERRHANLIYNMPDPIAKSELRDIDDEGDSLLDERYARENVNPKSKMHTLDMDWQIFAYTYEEPDVMELDGVMNGFSAEYTYRPDKDDLFYSKAVNAYRLEGMFAFGNLEYQADAGYGDDDNENYFYDLRAIIGKEFIHKDYDFMAYSGFGFRYLNDEEGEPILYQGTRYLGYERESHYTYIPFGFELTKRLKDNWSVVFSGEYDKLIVGWQISHLSDMNKYASSTPSEDVTDRQDSGYGFRGSVRLAKSVELVDFYVEPFFRYWNIDDSEIKTSLILGAQQTGLEPKNNTVEGGVKLGVQF